jgi:hypothetical protein
MECEHLIDGTCAVATKLAGVTVPADQRNCEVCLGCDSPKAENVATIGLARVTLRKMGLPSDHLYPESLRDGLELTKDAQTGPLLLVDGMGRAFLRELPWVETHQSGCDCFSYLRLMNNWGAGRCVSERSRIVGWFMGVAKQLRVEVAPSEIELAIFRAAETIRHRDEDAVASWPFLFTYYAAGAVGDELKYSIRSVLHHQPSARVIVIGDKPNWYTGEFIPKPRIPKTDFHAFRDCYSKLLFAAEQLPRFIWHMDDIYWVKPFTMAEATVPKYVRHVSQARFKAWNPHNTWGKTRAHAYRWLLDHNRPTYDFAAHLPQPIQSDKLLATEREVQMMTSRYRNWECVYFNTHHAADAEDWGRRYLRVTKKRDSIQTRHKVLNHTDSQFRGTVENYLKAQFPNPSVVEK